MIYLKKCYGQRLHLCRNVQRKRVFNMSQFRGFNIQGLAILLKTATIFFLMIPLFSKAASIQNEIVSPSEHLKKQDSVVLKFGTNTEMMNAVNVKRQFSKKQIVANPVIMLGTTKANLNPVLTNPKSLFNIAMQMGKLPKLVSVQADDLEVLEINEGLLIRSFLSYQFKTGACSNSGKRKKLRNIGVDCPSRINEQQRAAAFADPNDISYIAEPSKRSLAIANANKAAREADSEIDTYIEKLQADMQDPAKEKELIAEIGAAEVARLRRLNHEQLKADRANSGITQIEQVMFVPTTNKLQQLSRKGITTAATKKRPIKIIPVVLKNKKRSASKEPNSKPITKSIPSTIYLTGFTLGRNHEWSKQISKSIKWCVLGCKKTYYAKLYSELSYGFGLRFPIQMNGTYHYNFDKSNEKKTATFIANYSPINGTKADYTSTGLPSDKLFDGKEFVAEVKATAGMYYKLPVIGSSGISVDVGKDFTKDLPSPFTNGQFKPPAPGKKTKPMVKVFDKFDLIAGRANFGIAGGQLFPAIKTELVSDSLSFILEDHLKNKSTKISNSGQVIQLKINTDDSSSFTISDPVYNLSFLVTPGLNPRLFVDLGVWRNRWDWTVWFPELEVELPPGGIDFHCHADTKCKYQYLYSPTVSLTSDFGRGLHNWGLKFDKKWANQCGDDICERQLQFLRRSVMVSGQQMEKSGSTDISDMKDKLNTADRAARKYVDESRVRITEQASEGWVILSRAIWSKQCEDETCLKNIAELAKNMGKTAIGLHKLKPKEGSLQIQALALKIFKPKFQKEINSSKARVSLASKVNKRIRLKKKKLTPP